MTHFIDPYNNHMDQKLKVELLFCQVPGIIGSVLGLVHNNDFISIALFHVKHAQLR